MTAIPLNRQFYEWRENTDPLARSRFRAAAGVSNDLLGWSELIAKRRSSLLSRLLHFDRLHERLRGGCGQGPA